MTSKEKETILEVLKAIKSLDKYLYNISRCIKREQHKIFGLKSYDCHLLMQEVLPKAMKDCLPGKVSFAIVVLCHFFKELCGKVFNELNLEHLEHQITQTLCQLENIFPPFFSL